MMYVKIYQSIKYTQLHAKKQKLKMESSEYKTVQEGPAIMIVPQVVGWSYVIVCNFIWIGCFHETLMAACTSVVTTKICSILNTQPEIIAVCDSARRSRNVLEFACSQKKKIVIVKIVKGKTIMLWTKVKSNCWGHMAS